MPKITDHPSGPASRGKTPAPVVEASGKAAPPSITRVTGLADPADKKKKKPRPKETWRDLIEQVVVAILLAILIRGFEAEAFVIPTGSMAPTLKGRHREVACPECKDVFTVNASEETEHELNRFPGAAARETAVCTNCRFVVPIAGAPYFKGDRILVMKFPYDLPFLPGAGGPHRWDVVVFHRPEEPNVNYIKRLAGLPDEDLMIDRGDVYVRPRGSDKPFTIARKPAWRIAADAILVNDDSHRANKLKDSADWLRWKPNGFRESAPGVFAVDAKTEGRLDYRHVVPDPVQWESLSVGQRPSRPARASLITDFYSYNAATSIDPRTPVMAWLQSNWVGDLLVEFDLDLNGLTINEKAGKSIVVSLVKAGVRNKCVIDPATGSAKLYHGDALLGEAATPIVNKGSHSVRFANFDGRLTLWVDGKTPFGDGKAYQDAPEDSKGPAEADLAPVGLEFAGVSAKVSGLVIKRDIYYTRRVGYPDFAISEAEPIFSGNADRINFSPVVAMFDVLADPARFGPLMAKQPEPAEVYAIKPDNFMMLGDNSPHSSDGRAWGSLDSRWAEPDSRANWEVPRSLLIGKAFFIYWPHGVPFGPKVPITRDLLLPFRPYVERMTLIR